jgi:exonuclease III
MTQKAKLELNSLNVRGIKNAKKRKTLFQWLNKNHKGIVFLQETHSVEEDVKSWLSDWGSEVIFAHGTNNRCGVAIMLNKNFEYHINEV